MVKHTSAYKIPLALLNLWGKKSCDPLFHLALFHFRRILGRRGSWWEKCCECFKMFFYHQSRTKWRSTHVKATLRRVGLVWSDRKWFSNAPSVEVQCMCIAGVFAVICDFKPMRLSAPNHPVKHWDDRVGMNVPLKTNRSNKYAHVPLCHERVWRTVRGVCAYGARVVHHFLSNS